MSGFNFCGLRWVFFCLFPMDTNWVFSVTFVTSISNRGSLQLLTHQAGSRWRCFPGVPAGLTPTTSEKHNGREWMVCTSVSSCECAHWFSVYRMGLGMLFFHFQQVLRGCWDCRSEDHSGSSYFQTTLKAYRIMPSCVGTWIEVWGRWSGARRSKLFDEWISRVGHPTSTAQDMFVLLFRIARVGRERRKTSYQCPLHILLVF